MGSLLATNAIPMTLLTVAGSSVTGSYTLVGTFSSFVQLAIVVSNVNANLLLSFDGINDHLAVTNGSTNPCVIPLDFKSNLMTLPKASIYVKSSGSPSTGNLYISGFTSQTN